MSWLKDLQTARRDVDDAVYTISRVIDVLSQVDMDGLAFRLEVAMLTLEKSSKLISSGIDANLKEGLDEVNKNQAAIFNALFAAAVTEDKEYV